MPGAYTVRNGLAKKHRRLSLKTLKWKLRGEQEVAELRWMSRHSLRTLVKRGNSEALEFLGFGPNPRVEVAGFTLDSTNIRPGEAIKFSFVLTALRPELLMVDYVINFVKANGTFSSKVYKIKQIKLQKGESVEVTKHHVLQASATTYTLYPGTHHVKLQINGKPFGTHSFQLL